jgi:threonyl-tRNA synthetase
MSRRIEVHVNRRPPSRRRYERSLRLPLFPNYDKINGKVQRAEQMKVHTMLVIGKRDMEADAVSVRIHGKGNIGAKPGAEAIAEILLSIKERRGDHV